MDKLSIKVMNVLVYAVGGFVLGFELYGSIGGNVGAIIGAVASLKYLG